MNIKLSIPILKELSNREALVYFCALVVISKNPDASMSDIVRLSGANECTVFRHLDKFEEMGGLEIKRSKLGNRYSYTEPVKHYITIDSGLLDANVTKVVIGSLIRLKCWSRIATNIVDLSLNRVVHELGVQHNTIYSAIDAGLLTRGEKLLYFEFVHPSLCIN